MQLYYLPFACSLSPHIVINELGIPCDIIKVDGKTKMAANGKNFLSVSPNGYVPALELDSGDVITEGPAIVQYLADLKPEKKLAPANGTIERTHLQTWLNFISTELHKGMSPLFNPHFSAEVKSIFTDKLFKRFDYLETVLSKQEYLLGHDFSVADAYLFTVLNWCKGLKIDLAKWPALTAFVSRISSRPSVQAAIQAEIKNK